MPLRKPILGPKHGRRSRYSCIVVSLQDEEEASPPNGSPAQDRWERGKAPVVLRCLARTRSSRVWTQAALKDLGRWGGKTRAQCPVRLEGVQ